MEDSVKYASFVFICRYRCDSIMSSLSVVTKTRKLTRPSYSVFLRLNQQYHTHHTHHCHHAWWRQTATADPPEEKEQEVALQGEEPRWEPKFPPGEFDRRAGWHPLTTSAPATSQKDGGGEAKSACGQTWGGVFHHYLSSGAVSLPAGWDGDGDGRHGAGLRTGEGAHHLAHISTLLCDATSSSYFCV